MYSIFEIVSKYKDMFTSFPMIIVSLFLLIITIASQWIIFEKAGEQGWKSLVPFYNSYILYKISCGFGWLFILAFIPCIGIFFYIYMLYKLSKCFNYGLLFTVGLLILNFIFLAIIAFGGSTYRRT